MEQNHAIPKIRLRIALILPGLGRVNRGAETAFLELGKGLVKLGDVHVEMFGSGTDMQVEARFHRTPCIRRETFERWLRVPGVSKVPALRTEYHYEELTYVAHLAWKRQFKHRKFDAVIACTYPYVNWYLQWCRKHGGPAQIFVTQNGDWMCQASSREFKLFACDGLVCINPTYYERHRGRYRAVLIPNGVDPDCFSPASEPYIDERVPARRPVVLMSSALIPSKNVADGIRGVAAHRDAFLLIAGDGPERHALAELARRQLPNRHLFLGSVPRQTMPSLYRRAQAFLHTSQDEPFGIVYLEAAATELPCIVHDGAVQHWILGDTALYCDIKNPESIASALSRGLTLGESLGKSARVRVMSDWTWHALAAKYREFIQQLTRPGSA